MSTYDQQAKDSLECLVAHVFDHQQDSLIQGITYQELAKRIGRLNKHGEGHAHGMGDVLGRMGRLLGDLEGEWGEPIPHIQSLVVNKTGPLMGLPDDGIKEFWPDYPKMSKAEKHNRMETEHQKVVAFGSRWNQVLEALALPKIVPETAEPSKRPYGKGGESDAHKALKYHLRDHPDIVGADDGSSAIVEYPLPSFDEVDVVFKSPTECVEVQVKSKISDYYPGDYERGIYQTVKYAALLAAMAQDTRYDIPANTRSVLVLESRLPRRHAELAETLGINLVENVIVDES
jgi:hypothetical protein